MDTLRKTLADQIRHRRDLRKHRLIASRPHGQDWHGRQTDAAIGALRDAIRPPAGLHACEDRR